MKKCLLILSVALCFNLFSASFAELVIYNPNSGIYHSTSCAAGKKCKSCIKIEKAVVIKKGARPCKSCKG